MKQELTFSIKGAVLRGCQLTILWLFFGNAFAATVNCGIGEKISDALAPGAFIEITGVCKENLVITQDDVTLSWNGISKPTLRSKNKDSKNAIVIDGARRITLDRLRIVNSLNGVMITNGATATLTRLLVKNHTKHGVVVTDNATVTVERSRILSNGFNGILVDNGSVTNILTNTISDNGDPQTAPPHSGVGIEVTDGSNARIIGNTIEDNLADGIDVYIGSGARIHENTIQRNGLTGSSCGAAGGCGIQVARSRVQAGGNIIRDNGHAAVGVWNQSVYRTGTYLTPASNRGNPDNLFPFEALEQGTSGVAVEVGRNSLADLRQVNIHGSVRVFRAAYLNLRGDGVGPNVQCSVIDGNLDVNDSFSTARLTFTNVTGAVTVDPGSSLQGSTVCP